MLALLAWGNPLLGGGLYIPQDAVSGRPIVVSTPPSCAGARFIVVLTSFWLMENLKLRLSGAVLSIGNLSQYPEFHRACNFFSAKGTAAGPTETLKCEGFGRVAECAIGDTRGTTTVAGWGSASNGR